MVALSTLSRSVQRSTAPLISDILVFASSAPLDASKSCCAADLVLSVAFAIAAPSNFCISCARRVASSTAICSAAEYAFMLASSALKFEGSALKMFSKVLPVPFIWSNAVSRTFMFSSIEWSLSVTDDGSSIDDMTLDMFVSSATVLSISTSRSLYSATLSASFWSLSAFANTTVRRSISS